MGIEGGAANGATWTVIGAGSIVPREEYGCSGYALRPAPRGPVTLFDCGPGTIRALAGLGIALADVQRVVVSHFHPDHYLDLFALAFARRNPALGELGPIELVGPRGLEERLTKATEALGRWVGFENASTVEVDPGPEPAVLERDGLRLGFVRTRHTESSLAWRCDLGDTPGASVTYTGDSCEVAEVAELARDTGLFVAECSFPDESGTANHLTPSSAARLARDAGARRLLLTHFYPSVDPDEARAVAARTYSGPIELARDGRVYSIG